MLAQRSVACAALLLLTCASALSASDTTFVRRGARVKVFPFAAESVTGEVTRLVYDTLVIMPEGEESAVTFYGGDLRGIKKLQGRKTKWAKGGMYGGIAGVLIGFPLALLAGSACDYECNDFAWVWPATAVGGFAIGAGIGALSGTDRWVWAKLPAPPVALNVGTDGSMGLAFSLRL